MSPRLTWLRRSRRRVNRRLYRVLFRLYRTLFPTPRWRGPLDPGSVRRVLVIRDDRVGDMVVTTPLLTFLKDVAPHTEVDVLASPGNAAIARRHRAVTNVYVNDRTWLGWFRVLRRLRARRYDLVLSPVARKAMREGLTAAMVARRFTYKVSSWRPPRYQGLFTAVARIPPRLTHMSARTLYVGQYAFGVRPSPGDAARYPMRLEEDLDAGESVAARLVANRVDRFVAVNLSAGLPEREWSPEKCAAFIRLVLARHSGFSVLLTPAPGKEDRVGELVRRCASQRLVAVPALPLTDLIALVRRATLVVTPDTALVHIASACGRPVIALYAPRHPNDVPLWLPTGVPYRALASDLGAVVSDIPPARIAAAFDELWADVGRPAAATSAVRR